MLPASSYIYAGGRNSTQTCIKPYSNHNTQLLIVTFEQSLLSICQNETLVSKRKRQKYLTEIGKKEHILKETSSIIFSYD